jgi:tRNA modification GTPase
MTDTIIAQSTPPGQSALAMVRISGPLCEKIAKEALALPCPTPRSCHLRNYTSSDTDAIVDQVIAVFFPLKNSFTGETTLEISCHGNTFIVEKIIGDLLKRGCRIAKPGEFTKRAFLSGRIDLTQAESIAELISAQSDAELKIANHNLSGSLGKVYKSLQDRILNLQAQLEASIDFPEDEIESESNLGILRVIDSIIEEANQLVKNSAKKKHLSNTIKILLLGPANVGKSTLFNTILGLERALVTQTPGTTRDYISSEILMGDYRVELIDCAGIRKTNDSTESLGIKKAIELIDEAFLILYVVDRSLPYPTDLDVTALDKIQDKDIVIIENKNDLPRIVSKDEYPTSLTTIDICARLTNDVEKITSFIITHLNQKFPQDPSKEVIINARHRDLLDNALSHMKLAKKCMQKNEGVEFALQELHNSRNFIDEIIGLKTNEDVLDKLFNEFCIGK